MFPSYFKLVQKELSYKKNYDYIFRYYWFYKMRENLLFVTYKNNNFN